MIGWLFRFGDLPFHSIAAALNGDGVGVVQQPVKRLVGIRVRSRHATMGYFLNDRTRFRFRGATITEGELGSRLDMQY